MCVFSPPIFEQFLQLLLLLFCVYNLLVIKQHLFPNRTCGPAPGTLSTCRLFYCFPGHDGFPQAIHAVLLPVNQNKTNRKPKLLKMSPRASERYMSILHICTPHSVDICIDALLYFISVDILPSCIDRS